LTRTKTLKAVLFVSALVPATLLIAGLFSDDLGANPVEYITHQTGWFGLAFLMASLAITPLRRISGWNEVIRVRRMLGLFAFFYATLHFLTWFVFDHTLDVAGMVEDVVERPYITVGMAAFVIMLPLAVTSNAAMIRRLGRKWRLLHRLAYLAAIAAVVHFWWLVKADVREPQRWALVLAVLLGIRAWWTFRVRTLSRS
jgi:methionine sulfoxide reductase heme-binding subunit